MSSLKATSKNNGNNGGGGRTGIPTLRSLRTLFAPTSSQQQQQPKPSKDSQPSKPTHKPKSLPSRPSLNLPSNSRQSLNTPSRSSLNLKSRQSFTLPVAEVVSAKEEEDKEVAVMDIRPESPQDLSTIVEADTSGLSGVSLSKHLPEADSDVSFSLSPSPSPLRQAYSVSPSPSPVPQNSISTSRSASASASSLLLPRSPSSIDKQVRGALRVDPALAALLSPNSHKRISDISGAPLSPTFSKSTSKTYLEPASSHSSSPSPLLNSPPSPHLTQLPSSSSLHLYPQTASTPYSTIRTKHLGLVRPPYIRSPASSDDSISVSASRLGGIGSSASASTSRLEPGLDSSSRVGAGLAVSRPGTSMSSHSLSFTLPRKTRNRSMSVDEPPRFIHSPSLGASTSSLAGRRERDTNILARRQHYSTHTRSLSHFDRDRAVTSQSEAGDVPMYSTYGTRQRHRPPMSEWLGPRTAKAFRAAGFLANEHEPTSSVRNDPHLQPESMYHRQNQTISPVPGSPGSPLVSLSAPSSPIRPRYAYAAYTPDSPGAQSHSESPSPTWTQYPPLHHVPGNMHTPHPRAASARSASVLSGSGSVRSASVSAGMGRSASVLSGSVRSVSGRSLGSLGSLGRSASVRSASTAPTSASLSLSLSAQATREYLGSKQSQSQKRGSGQEQGQIPSSSSSTLNLNLPPHSVTRSGVAASAVPPISTSSPAPSTPALIASTSTEVQLVKELKEQHSVETSALLAALSDTQRSSKVLREENKELREALRRVEGGEGRIERERSEELVVLREENVQLREGIEIAERENEELRDVLGVLKGGRRTLEEERTRFQRERAEWEKERASWIRDKAKLESKLKNAESRALSAQKGKERVEAEAEMRAEKALRRIEYLEEALSLAQEGEKEDTGVLGLDGLETSEKTNSEVAAETEFIAPSSASSLSESSSRPPSVFPLPPENMSLLINEVTGEGVSLSEPEVGFPDHDVRDRNTDQGSKEGRTGDEVRCDDDLDFREDKWRRSLNRNSMGNLNGSNVMVSGSKLKPKSKLAYIPTSPASKSASTFTPASTSSSLRLQQRPQTDSISMRFKQPYISAVGSYARMDESSESEPSFSYPRSALSRSVYEKSSRYKPKFQYSESQDQEKDFQRGHENDLEYGNDEYEYDESMEVGNATFYHVAEEDSLISDSDHSQSLGLDDADPTVHANANSGSHNHNHTVSHSIPTDDATSFEGTGTPGTPGSPGSLLWMHPSDERHLVDLDSVDDVHV